MSVTKPSTAREDRHKAGLLDIRTIIGGLLAVYGVILVLEGLLGDDGGAKTGDVNANLWSGIVLFVVGVAFLVWVRVRPLMVPEHKDDADELRQDNVG